MNIGHILLCKREIAKSPDLCASRLQIEDNVGEGIHLHYRNLRLDFSIRDFLAFAGGTRRAQQVLAMVKPFSPPEDYPPAANIKKFIVREKMLSELKCDLLDPEIAAFLLHPITQTPAYRFLQSEDPTEYNDYYEKVRALHNPGDSHTPEKLLDLKNKIEKEGYREDRLIICRLTKEGLVIADGQNRAAILMFLKGDHKVKLILTTDIG